MTNVQAEKLRVGDEVVFVVTGKPVRVAGPVFYVHEGCFVPVQDETGNEMDVLAVELDYLS